VQDHAQQRTVNLKTTAIFDETEFPELIQKEIHARTRGANHLCQCLLGQFREHLERFVLISVP
jgi:hypothetical protein